MKYVKVLRSNIIFLSTPLFEIVAKFELLKLELCLHFFRECYTFYPSCRCYCNHGNKVKFGILTFQVSNKLDLLFM